jgi:DNA polymerase-3 subunit epsilon
MRRVFLDTETTGFDFKAGDRLIEVGAVEVIDRRPTGRQMHHLINPGRAIPADATAIHGIRDEDVTGKPAFEKVADEIIEFVKDSELCMHNAGFDVGFLDAELERIGRPRLSSVCRIVDTLRMAKENAPGKRASLDALCERYGVDNRSRTVHGALLDADLLARVWIAMTRGQASLDVEVEQYRGVEHVDRSGRLDLVVIKPTDAEISEHERMLERLRKQAKAGVVWDRCNESAEGAEVQARVRPG